MGSLTALWRHPFYRFIGLGALFFILWHVGYELFLKQATGIDHWIINIIIHWSDYLLNLLNYTTLPIDPNEIDIRTVGIDGSHGVWVGDPCNGLSLFALFTGFVLAFPGPIIHKAWYIPVGLLAIHTLNVLRVTALSIIQFKAPEYLDFNHTYTFTIIVYGFVFLLWYLWAQKLSKS